MILAIDVDYREDHAVAAGVMFESWAAETPVSVYHTFIESVEDYVSGQFYKRELPCIQALLRQHDLAPKCIVVDGFVVLGAEQKPGLGMYLYNALEQKIPVVGVAKKSFAGVDGDAEIYRGESSKALFVSAVGIELKEAKMHIKNMHGKFRLPNLLKLADTECRRVSLLF